MAYLYGKEHQAFIAKGATGIRQRANAAYADWEELAKLKRDADNGDIPARIAFDQLPDTEKRNAEYLFEVYGNPPITKARKPRPKKPKPQPPRTVYSSYSPPPPRPRPQPRPQPPSPQPSIIEKRAAIGDETLINRAIRRDALDIHDPRTRALAEKSLSYSDRESYFHSWIGGDPIRLQMANRLGYSMDDFLPKQDWLTVTIPPDAQVQMTEDDLEEYRHRSGAPGGSAACADCAECRKAGFSWAYPALRSTDPAEREAAARALGRPLWPGSPAPSAAVPGRSARVMSPARSAKARGG